MPEGGGLVPREAAGHRAQGAQHRRPPGAGRLALPFLRGQPRARVRPHGRLRAAPQHSGVHGAPLRARRRARGEPGALPGQARGLRLQQPGRRRDRRQDRRGAQGEGGRAGREARLPFVRPRRSAEPQHSPREDPDGNDFTQRVRRPVRSHHRRPHPPRRHRPLRRDRARPARRARRRDRLRRRQEPARRHGHGQPDHARGRRARPGDHQRDDHRRGARRGEGRRRHQGRPHLRHRQGRQPADDGRDHAGPRVRPRDRRDLGRAPDPDRRAASTRTSTTSRRSRRTRRCPTARRP